ncbi:MAG: two pore domain potassium channel family protein [Chloroflexi bacterium]|nr:two pore domain potassium channel family protein [Chloroflexota bacterium]
MLTPEQQHALDTLLANVPKNGETTAVGPAPVGPTADFLQTWFGVTGSQLKEYLDSLLQQKGAWQDAFLTYVEDNPLDSAFAFLGAAAAAFYTAEKEANPKIKTYVDAFYYIATCASVGYADVFAVTQSGKVIASLVMVVGPGLADRALNRPNPLAPAP